VLPPETTLKDRTCHINPGRDGIRAEKKSVGNSQKASVDKSVGKRVDSRTTGRAEKLRDLGSKKGVIKLWGGGRCTNKKPGFKPGARKEKGGKDIRGSEAWMKPLCCYNTTRESNICKRIRQFLQLTCRDGGKKRRRSLEESATYWGKDV